MRSALATAITQKFKSDSNLQALLSGGLYYKQAPQGSSSPWGAFHIITIDRDEYMGSATNCRLMIDLQISLYSTATDGGDELDLISSLLGTTFDWQGLYVDGYRVDSVAPGPISEAGIVDGVAQIDMTYEIGMMKE